MTILQEARMGMMIANLSLAKENVYQLSRLDNGINIYV